MSRLGVVIVIVIVLLVACSKEDGGVTGSEPKEILDKVQLDLEQADMEAEARLKEAMDRIE